jgi:capsular polysaccharide biosynthesis protein
LINEAELLQELDKYGFRSYILEDLRFREQVKLFSGAEIIIGPHGAGFTNTIFADDLTVLELFGSDELSHSLCYYGIANANEFDYAALRVPQQGNGLQPDPEKVSSLVEGLL